MNASGAAARRIFDVASGRKLGETLIREGAYRQAFPEDLNDTIRLNGSWSDAEQDEWGEELPSSVLDALQRDLIWPSRQPPAIHTKRSVSRPIDRRKLNFLQPTIHLA